MNKNMSSSEQNKLVKTLTDASLLIGLSAGVGYVGKKMMKESFISDPSSSIVSYAKWVAVLTGSMYLKNYLEDQKIIPKTL